MEASKLVKLFLRGREDGTSEPCVGDAEGIAEEEWALKLGIFPGLVVVLIFLESSTRLLLRRRLRLRSHVCWARRRAILFD